MKLLCEFYVLMPPLPYSIIQCMKMYLVSHFDFSLWLVFKNPIIRKFICLGFFLMEIQKLNCFANKARKTKQLCCG